jgi:hypothetical protein
MILHYFNIRTLNWVSTIIVWCFPFQSDRTSVILVNLQALWFTRRICIEISQASFAAENELATAAFQERRPSSLVQMVFCHVTEFGMQVVRKLQSLLRGDVNICERALTVGSKFECHVDAKSNYYC